MKNTACFSKDKENIFIKTKDEEKNFMFQKDKEKNFIYCDNLRSNTKIIK